MYESHWGLEQSPFTATPDPKYFYESPTHNEALARLHFLVENNRRLGLLLGPSGSGKSLVLEVFAQQLQRAGHQVAAINLLGMQADEFLPTLAEQLGISVTNGTGRFDTGRFDLWRKITDRLAENRYQQQSTIVLLDDADLAAEETLQLVLRLLHADPSPQSHLTVVLAGQAGRVGALGHRLLDLAELRIELEPLDSEETDAYLTSCVNKAGRETPLFDPPAAQRLHDLTHGIPRQISQLAELALLAGAGQNLTKIDEQTVESVYRELKVTVAGR